MVRFFGDIVTNVKDTLGFDADPVRREGGSPRTTGGGQSGSRAYSQRDPTPKPIGGPVVSTLTGVGTSVRGILDDGGIIFNRLIGGARQTSQDVQEISGKTQEAISGAFTAVTGAPGAVVGGVTDPVGQLSKDILPLAAIAAAIVLLK